MHSFYTRMMLLGSLLLIALLVLPCAFAQETTGGFQGTVKDPSGAVITGATIEISSSVLGTRKTQTDSAGLYRFDALPPGQYTVTVTATGFQTYKQVGLALAAGRQPTIDIQMQVGAVTSTVEVTGAAPVIDLTQSKVAVTVDRSIMDSIPMGRSFESLIPFAPGARQEPLQGGYQIDGASDGENVFMIDGVNTTDILNGGSGKSFQMDFIQEVQVKSSGFEAEHGGALGGVINAIPKRGSNSGWHGSLVTYLSSNSLNANNGDRGLRTNPLLPSGNATTRLDATPEYFNAVKDQSNTIEPGYEVGGALIRNRLWLQSGYIPRLSTTRRLTVFTGLNPGPRALTSTTTTHNAYNRLDYGITSRLRLFGAWNYAYQRNAGTLGGQESNIPGQRNTGASTDPNTLRSDLGSVNPNATYSFGGDWTPTSKLVVTARYGYLFQNSEQRGIPVGTRYLYSQTVNAAMRDLGGQAFPASSINTSGYANIPSNLAYVFNAFKRKSFNVDSSYFTRFAGGTHTFKGGFFWAGQSNDVLRNYNGGAISLQWGQSYDPQTDTAICNNIKAQNVANFGAAANVCQGRYGYFVVGTGVVNTGTSQQSAHALYFQDDWQVGKGLTLQLGVRFDEETQPPYDPKRFPTVHFGWGDKIAPRIGGAYDLLHNGKIKVFASYGKFYDIMKMGLARGSFGSDYWHNCVYAMDDADYTKITPAYPIGGGCPATGPAPGVNVGRFIENVDYRATKADPRDPAISPTMKPMAQHNYAAGVDWAINPSWSLETRYSRNRLDNTIEDMAITDNMGFYIGNPGTLFADVLHRPLSIPCPAGSNCAGTDKDGNYLTSVPFCAECPATVPAIRRYDGVEFRLTKKSQGKWFGTVTYSYSKLRGNYSGLTNTDPTDGGTGGRHSPNNSRLFDIPTMTYLPNGQIDDGPLSTDRPHTGKVYGFYRQKWFGMETNFGFTQIAYQGVPINSCLPVVATSSACQWVEGRGNYVNITRAANGDFVKGDVVNNARTDVLFQTDLFIHHEIKTSESTRFAIEGNITNLLNQRTVHGVYEFITPANYVQPARAKRFPGDLGLDWAKVMQGYNYIDAVNATGAFAGNVPGTSTKIQSALYVASRYGMPNSFQGARNIRLAVRFTF